MKTAAQIKFDTIIKEGFASLLKPLSFKKKALNFYRQLPGLGHIINIQKSSYGDSCNIKFRINVGVFEPRFYLAKYDFKRTGVIPDYPTEPVCLIRKTINDLRHRKDLWYEVGEGSDEQALIGEMQMNLRQYILPFLESLDSIDKIFQALEKDPYLPSMPLALLVFYGEYGRTAQARAVYEGLVRDINPLAEGTLKGYAKKYKLG